MKTELRAGRLRPVAVKLDGLTQPGGKPKWFPAFTTGETWNGFATPYFERDVGEEVVRAFNDRTAVNHCGTTAGYDPNTDAFVFHDDEDGDAEAFAAVEFEGRKLYPIGAWFWSWTSNDLEN